MNWIEEWRKVDPLRVAREFWPSVRFYREQRDILYSIKNNDETVVVAGNGLGKDFTAGFACLEMAIVAAKLGCTFRIVNTSVKDDHLRVLWGEISRFIDSSRHPLKAEDGGPFIFNHRDIRLARDGKDGYSYLRGMVSERGEGLAGHWANLTLGVGDESSGLDNEVWRQFEKWALRRFFFGNPRPTNNRFKADAQKGDVDSSNPGRKYRKVFWLNAEHSPNVRLARAQIKAGLRPTNEQLIPGGMTWDKLQLARTTWDVMEQTIGLDGLFYAGKELLLFPPEWLARAEAKHVNLLMQGAKRQGKAIGVDPAEGGDKTAWCVIDELGVLEMISMRTPDTTVIPGTTFELMRKWNVPADRVCFDRGGGYTHACTMRAGGANVRTVAFGEGINLEPKRGMRHFGEKVEHVEERYAYVNRRAQMYHEASLLLDPMQGCQDDAGTLHGGPRGFAVPRGEEALDELVRQLGLMPKLTDPEGRYRMLPKTRTTKGMPDPEGDKDEDTLVGLVGHSPDEADAFVLAIHGLLHRRPKQKAGTIG